MKCATIQAQQKEGGRTQGEETAGETAGETAPLPQDKQLKTRNPSWVQLEMMEAYR